MKVIVYVLVVLFCAAAKSEVLENWLNNDLYSCIKCLCHARSGCWIRQNCARYSISYDYWIKAGALRTDLSDQPNHRSSYDKCIKDENCIVGTIINYTESFGELDCNCDGHFDCKDRLAIHLKGPNCEKPVFGLTYARRFNECAASIGVKTMLSKEGGSDCTVPDIDIK